MRRRKFLTLLGGVAVAWPLAARAQQTGKLPTVAFILVRSNALTDVLSAAFTERLRELGWTAGRNVAIEHHWSEGRPERIAEIVAELVQQKVHVIFTTGSRACHTKAGDNFHPYRVNRERSGRQRLRRKPFASWRQRHGFVDAGSRKCW